jgi:hypothetical protein
MVPVPAPGLKVTVCVSGDQIAYKVMLPSLKLYMPPGAKLTPSLLACVFQELRKYPGLVKVLADSASDTAEVSFGMVPTPPLDSKVTL